MMLVYQVETDGKDIVAMMDFYGVKMMHGSKIYMIVALVYADYF